MSIRRPYFSASALVPPLLVALAWSSSDAWSGSLGYPAPVVVAAAIVFAILFLVGGVAAAGFGFAAGERPRLLAVAAGFANLGVLAWMLSAFG